MYVSLSRLTCRSWSGWKVCHTVEAKQPSFYQIERGAFNMVWCLSRSWDAARQFRSRLLVAEPERLLLLLGDALSPAHWAKGRFLPPESIP